MTIFNKENKDSLTYLEALGPAMDITEQEDADQYLAAYIKYLEKFKDEMPEGNTPEKVAKINLGYFAGYCNKETQKRVETLFKTHHPVFGATK